MGRQVTLNVFKQALELLDDKLGALPESEQLWLPINIRAIGGFALMFHNVRESGLTSDIDTVTVDYSPAVEQVIKDVAEELDLVEDWLNNYNVMANDIRSVEIMLLPKWEKSEWEFAYINLFVADLEALLRSKIIASDDDRDTGRGQDYPDMLAIFIALGCENMDDVIEQCECMDINLKYEYPWNYERLSKDIAESYSKWEESHKFDNELDKLAEVHEILPGADYSKTIPMSGNFLRQFAAAFSPEEVAKTCKDTKTIEFF